jgi:hypothetical protein
MTTVSSSTEVENKADMIDTQTSKIANGQGANEVVLNAATQADLEAGTLTDDEVDGTGDDEPNEDEESYF